MTTQRRRGLHDDLRTTDIKKQPTTDKYPARRLPIQHEIQKLEDELNAFNERESKNWKMKTIEVMRLKC